MATNAKRSLPKGPQQPLKRLYAGDPAQPARTLGAPRVHTKLGKYETAGGLTVECNCEILNDPTVALEAMVDHLDTHRGCLFESSYDFPGRYARWTMGFSDPPLVLEAIGRNFTVVALNARGRVLLPPIGAALRACPSLESLEEQDAEGTAQLRGVVRPADDTFAEEDRSRQHSIFSITRTIQALFHFDDEPQLGLYGAFGYDLTFQFEPVKLHQKRDPTQRDLVLFIPDKILVIDILSNAAWTLRYEFTTPGGTTSGLPREGSAVAYMPTMEASIPRRRDHEAGAFAKKVERAKEEFKVGNLFETVLSQTFFEPCPQPPSTIFRRLRKRNPSPYGFLLNLGKAEYLVGASPEMFVRVEKNKEGWRCETCPISGTIKRGANAMEDAANIQKILSDKKEESELTMCTDVDRNDKSRICRAGSVQVIGRRQIEMYSRLIHTVDHVEGYLREGFDAMDAFLCHTWAVTVTGAPKTWAIQFVENQEESPRCWYGGAVGMLGFDGHLNTGLTLRTVRIANGVAEVRAGATLLFDSEPEAEERETELKASAMRDAVLCADSEVGSKGRSTAGAVAIPQVVAVADAPRVLLVDHQDSFVHTLANYLRQIGAIVTTLRSGFEPSALDQLQPRLIVLSPGPGCPKDFGLSRSIDLALERRIPIFGVCLGLQGLVEHFGGELGVLSYPQHGKPAEVHLQEPRGALFEEMPETFQVGRYHSLHSLLTRQPAVLRTTASTTDGVVMAIQHTSLPIAAVQFHPESILTPADLGLKMLSNALTKLRYE
eukprot:CAMPEP_0174717792 /NCGR_PEP_ID=MMETSP1094-20130205/27209_1 /TAXON_ID=156173 /ORGANISM="Chrysochromulina brevifilum, Strain UTEX LB 985" /LENGTH=773 /DNA_ID=CAMNT_0015917789 /DNA_START=12 /DNA_END=2333 /DNA_ORIENTATION=+